MRRNWNFALALVAVSVLSAFSRAQVIDEELPNDPRPGRYTVTIRWQGFDRFAHVQVPKDFKPGRLLPVVLLFHDAGGDGVLMLDKNGWADRANLDGFIAVAPTALPALPLLGPNFRANPRLWNSGQLPPRLPRAAIDDVKYVSKLLSTLQERTPYDQVRVFAAGHGNGATMAFRLGAELSQQLAAIAAVGGNPQAVQARPEKPLPTLYIIGDEDPLQPLDGGEVDLTWTNPRQPPVAKSLESWAERIECAVQPEPISDQNGLKWLRYPSLNDGPSRHGVPCPGTRSHLAWRRTDPHADLDGPRDLSLGRHQDHLAVFRRFQ